MSATPGKAAHLRRGEDAENACCRYLQKQGLRLLERNYRCRMGELDLIMREADTLVFVEVRFRKQQDFGGALASITPAKQKKLRRAAEFFMQQNRLDCSARFDVVAMSPAGQHSRFAIRREPYHYEWIRNAF